VDIVDKITLPPWQKVVAPDAVTVGVTATAVTVTIIAEEFAVQELSPDRTE